MASNHHRGDQRIRVDLPVDCTFEDHNRKVTVQGRVEDLSINGMKIALPLSAELLDNCLIDFNLELPNPFSKIKGYGKVQWQRWDAKQQCSSCGLKLEPMTLKQLSDIDAIINDIKEDKATVID